MMEGRAVDRRDTNKSTHARTQLRRLQCRMCGAPWMQRAVGRIVATIKKSKDCQEKENKLWLKTDGVMLTDDKEKTGLHNCFSSELLLSFCRFCLFSSVLLLFPNSRVFRLDLLDKNKKRKYSPCCVKPEKRSTPTLSMGFTLFI